MTNITKDTIVLINEIYQKTQNYAETARQTGLSNYMVKKYVIPNYTRPAEKKIVDLSIINNLPETQFIITSNWGELCVLTEEEKEDLKKLWQEMEI